MALTSSHEVLAATSSHGVGVAASPRLRPVMLRAAAWVAGGVVGLYLVGRAIVELFIIDYPDPSSYAQSWGGPSLAGVFAVHSDPGAAVLLGVCIWVIRRWRERRAQVVSPRPSDRENERAVR